MTQENFLNELRKLTKTFVSPKLESIKSILRNQANEGNSFCFIDKNDIDAYTMEYLLNEGLTIREKSTGDGKIIVAITWK